MAKGSNGAPPAAGELRLLIERAQRIREEIKELQADEKDVYNEAKSRGFDTPTIKAVMKWMEKDPNKRNEEAALFEVYRSALGLGEGSLSDLARDWLNGKRGDAAVAAEDGEGQLNAFPTRAPTAEDFGDALEDEDAEALTPQDAERLGAEAAKSGRPVSANPFRPGDERRAAWDGAWCAALGTDGMDIPAELRPTPKAKKGEEE